MLEKFPKGAPNLCRTVGDRVFRIRSFRQVRIRLENVVQSTGKVMLM